MSREINFRRTETYNEELATIREFNRKPADQIEEKRVYFERCLTHLPIAQPSA